MKKFFADFKEFALKGNIFDMAVGIVIGSAFSKIISSLVDYIISPVITLLTSGATLEGLGITLREAVMEGEEVIREAVVLSYGAFLQSIIDFIIIALCIFIVLRVMMTAKKKAEELTKKNKEEEIKEEAPADTELSVLLEIKELLQKK